MSENNAVLVGRKPVMNYVLACITLFHGGAKEINVKARGQAISRAVDIVEITRRRFLPNVKIKSIDIGTEQLEFNDDKSGSGVKKNVSSIEIILAR